MNFILNLLSLRTFGLIAVITVIGVVLYNLYWDEPELWNPTAKGYKTHAAKLSVDSSATGKLLVLKDTTINRLSRQAATALKNGQDWRAKFNGQVVAQDAMSSKLTDKQAEVAYYRALLKNGTLQTPVVSLSALTPDNPVVIRAGLNTANREAYSTAAADSMAGVIGYFDQSNKRLSAGLLATGRQARQLAQDALNAKKGGIWPANAKRRKQLTRVAAKANAIADSVEAISEMERIYNGQKPR